MSEFGAPAIVIAKPRRTKLPLVIPIRPKGYIRRTRQGRFSKAAKRYHEWCNEFRLLCHQANNREPLHLPEAVAFTFIFKAPKSDPQRRGPHRQKPDRDNCEKACIDALHPEGGDERMWAGASRKIWGTKDQIIIELLDVGEWPPTLFHNTPDEVINGYQQGLF